MNKKELEFVTAYFEEKYPSPLPKLKYGSPYQLLISVILSAQCTDDRVNKVTASLFEQHGEPNTMLELSVEELEKYIFSCGLYHSKARHILSATNDIVYKFGGKVPEDYDSLQTLGGVGRKTANVVSSVAFSRDAIAVDTHVFRVSNRLGMVLAKTPLATEKQLMEIIPQNKWSKYHHYLIFHGREVCHSQNPDCANCKLCGVCAYYKKTFRAKTNAEIKG